MVVNVAAVASPQEFPGGLLALTRSMTGWYIKVLSSSSFLVSDMLQYIVCAIGTSQSTLIPFHSSARLSPSRVLDGRQDGDERQYL